MAGGGEYAQKAQPSAPTLPFAGGTGAGVTVQPMGFLVVGKESVRLLPAQYYAPVDRMIELAPQLMCEIKNALMKWCKKDGAENRRPTAGSSGILSASAMAAWRAPCGIPRASCRTARERA